jgi:putative tryptophan/tyrosine transport system substrate-binding protein
MKRREFIALLGGAATWPLAARAQQRALPMIGLLSSRSPAVDASLIALIRQGLNETGAFRIKSHFRSPLSIRFKANAMPR